jgi:hypothetical protein
MRLMAQKNPFFVFSPPKQGRIGPPWKQKSGSFAPLHKNFLYAKPVLPDLRAADQPESTRGEVTRIRYPVTRITYLKTFCVKRINLVYSLNVPYLLHFSARENVAPPHDTYTRT